MKDPRLRLSAVIMVVQVLGQLVLGFSVSVAQIVVAITTAAVIEAAITFWRGGGLRWPASALLTGNGVALILRASGTRHGDWLSLHGAEYFVVASAIGILSKYAVRPFGRHLYNPSNIGLVLGLLLAGPGHAFPQYLWWGPLGAPVLAAWAVILVGAVWVLRPLGMASMVLVFTITFGVLVALVAAGGGCFYATWRADSVCGANYWIGIVASPELAIFALFMMSDPRTIPAGRGGRMAYAAATAVIATAMLSIQSTEYGVKLAILASLTITCTGIPLAAWAAALVRRRWRTVTALADPRRGFVPAGLVVAVAATAAVSLAVVSMSGSQQLLDLERGRGISPDTPRQQGLSHPVAPA